MAHPWDQNEHGLWCSACGEHIAAAWHLDEDGYEPPQSCKTCGFPDFEEGHGYFTDDERGTPS
jgi:hypothetical protein